MKFERFAYIVGTLLLGAATGFLLSGRKNGGSRARRSAPPVEELAKQLGDAWSGHHLP